MTATAPDRTRSQWQKRLDEITKERQGNDVTIEVLDREFGDEYEVQRLPLASLTYDPKDDVAVVAVGGRDRRLPVVLRHVVEHPQQILAEAVPVNEALIIEIVDADGDQTFVTLHPPAGGPETGR
jgi:hypothetical protein